jgi:hypothetical protein
MEGIESLQVWGFLQKQKPSFYHIFITVLTFFIVPHVA